MIWVIFLPILKFQNCIPSNNYVLPSPDFVFIFPVLRPKMSFEKCQTKGLFSDLVTHTGFFLFMFT